MTTKIENSPCGKNPPSPEAAVLIWCRHIESLSFKICKRTSSFATSMMGTTLIELDETAPLVDNNYSINLVNNCTSVSNNQTVMDCKSQEIDEKATVEQQKEEMIAELEYTLDSFATGIASVSTSLISDVSERLDTLVDMHERVIRLLKMRREMTDACPVNVEEQTVWGIAEETPAPPPSPSEASVPSINWGEVIQEHYEDALFLQQHMKRDIVIYSTLLPSDDTCKQQTCKGMKYVHFDKKVYFLNSVLQTDALSDDNADIMQELWKLAVFDSEVIIPYVKVEYPSLPPTAPIVLTTRATKDIVRGQEKTKRGRKKISVEKNTQVVKTIPSDMLDTKPAVQKKTQPRYEKTVKIAKQGDTFNIEKFVKFNLNPTYFDKPYGKKFLNEINKGKKSIVRNISHRGGELYLVPNWLIEVGTPKGFSATIGSISPPDLATIAWLVNKNITKPSDCIYLAKMQATMFVMSYYSKNSDPIFLSGMYFAALKRFYFKNAAIANLETSDVEYDNVRDKYVDIIPYFDQHMSFKRGDNFSTYNVPKDELMNEKFKALSAVLYDIMSNPVGHVNNIFVPQFGTIIEQVQSLVDFRYDVPELRQIDAVSLAAFFSQGLDHIYMNVNSSFVFNTACENKLQFSPSKKKTGSVEVPVVLRWFDEEKCKATKAEQDVRLEEMTTTNDHQKVVFEIINAIVDDMTVTQDYFESRKKILDSLDLTITINKCAYFKIMTIVTQNNFFKLFADRRGQFTSSVDKNTCTTMLRDLQAPNNHTLINKVYYNNTPFFHFVKYHKIINQIKIDMCKFIVNFNPEALLNLIWDPFYLVPSFIKHSISDIESCSFVSDINERLQGFFRKAGQSFGSGVDDSVTRSPFSQRIANTLGSIKDIAKDNPKYVKIAAVIADSESDCIAWANCILPAIETVYETVLNSIFSFLGAPHMKMPSEISLVKIVAAWFIYKRLDKTDYVGIGALFGLLFAGSNIVPTVFRIIKRVIVNLFTLCKQTLTKGFKYACKGCEMCKNFLFGGVEATCKESVANPLKELTRYVMSNKYDICQSFESAANKSELIDIVENLESYLTNLDLKCVPISDWDLDEGDRVLKAVTRIYTKLTEYDHDLRANEAFGYHPSLETQIQKVLAAEHDELDDIQNIIDVIASGATRRPYFDRLTANRTVVGAPNESVFRAFLATMPITVAGLPETPTEQTDQEETSPPQPECTEGWLCWLKNQWSLQCPKAIGILGVAILLAIGVNGASSIFKKKNLGEIIVDSLKNFHFTSLGLVAIPAIYKTIVGTVTWAVQQYRDWKHPENAQSGNVNDKVEAWIRKCAIVQPGFLEAAFNRDCRVGPYFESLKMEGLSLNRDICKIEPRLKIIFESTWKRVLALDTKISTLMSIKAGRFEPLHVQFFSEPGIGKSNISPEFIKVIKGVMGINSETYSLNEDLEHLDAYFGQEICNIDDCNALKEDSKVLMKLLMFSGAPFIPPMAELSDKGKTLNFKLITSATNVPFPQDRNVVEPKAIWRRRHLVKVKINPNVYENQAEVTGTTNSRLQNFLFDVLVPTDPNMIPVHDCLENITWKQLLEYFTNVAKYHVEKEKVRAHSQGVLPLREIFEKYKKDVVEALVADIPPNFDGIEEITRSFTEYINEYHSSFSPETDAMAAVVIEQMPAIDTPEPVCDECTEYEGEPTRAGWHEYSSDLIRKFVLNHPCMMVDMTQHTSARHGLLPATAPLETFGPVSSIRNVAMMTNLTTLSQEHLPQYTDGNIFNDPHQFYLNIQPNPHYEAQLSELGADENPPSKWMVKDMCYCVDNVDLFGDTVIYDTVEKIMRECVAFVDIEDLVSHIDSYRYLSTERVEQARVEFVAVNRPTESYLTKVMKYIKSISWSGCIDLLLCFYIFTCILFVWIWMYVICKMLLTPEMCSYDTPKYANKGGVTSASKSFVTPFIEYSQQSVFEFIMSDDNRRIETTAIAIQGNVFLLPFHSVAKFVDSELVHVSILDPLHRDLSLEPERSIFAPKTQIVKLQDYDACLVVIPGFRSCKNIVDKFIKDEELNKDIWDGAAMYINTYKDKKHTSRFVSNVVLRDQISYRNSLLYPDSHPDVIVSENKRHFISCLSANSAGVSRGDSGSLVGHYNNKVPRPFVGMVVARSNTSNVYIAPITQEMLKPALAKIDEIFKISMRVPDLHYIDKEQIVSVAASCPVVGAQVPKVVQAEKTRYVKSVIHDCPEFLNVTAPSILSNSDPRYLQVLKIKPEVQPFDSIGVNKYNKPSVEISVQEMMYRAKQLALRDASFLKYARLQTLLESVRGSGKIGSTPLDTNTSCGLPWKVEKVGKGKKAWIDVDETTGTYKIHNKVYEKVDEYLEELDKGDVTMRIFDMFLKDETVPIKKIFEEPKTRTVTGAGLEVTIVNGMLFGDICRLYKNEPCTNTRVAVGLNIESNEINDIVRWLEFHETMIAFDVKNWDGWFPNALLLSVANYYYWTYFYAFKFADKEMPPTLRRRIFAFVISQANSLCCYQNVIFHTFHGMKSGERDTLVKNSVGHKILDYFFYCNIMNTYKPSLCNVSAYEDIVRSIFCGDDVLRAIHPKYAHVLTPQTFVDQYNLLGCDVTTAKKDLNFRFENILQVTFVKMNFRYDILMQRWTVDPDESIITNLLNWVSTTQTFSIQNYDNMLNASRFAWHKGKNYYEQFTSKLEMACLKANFKFTTIDYDSMRAWIEREAFLDNSHIDFSDSLEY